MSFYINSTELKEAYFNGSEVKSIYYNGVNVWESWTWPGWSAATWQDIYKLCKQKQAGTITAWPSDVVVGASKTVTLSTAVLDTTSVEAYIIGVDIDGNGILTFQCGALTSSTQWATSNTITWTSSTIKTVCNNFYSYCNAKSYIKTLSKGIWDASTSTISYYSLTVWPLSVREMKGASGGWVEEYTNGVSTAYSGIKYYSSVWTRTTANNKNYRYYTNSSGGANTSYATSSLHTVSPCFAIG